MSLAIQPEARLSRSDVPYVRRISDEVLYWASPTSKPAAPDYWVYGSVRKVVPIQTSSGYVANLLSPGVVNVATVARLKTVVATQAATETLVRNNYAEWMDAVAVVSDSSQMVSHPAYLRIVALGDAAIPCILRSIRKKPSLLAWALFDITKVNPVRPADYGKIDKITKARLKWGKKNKYI